MTPRILLVEDEDNLRTAIRINLEMEGYEVVQATTGTEAVKKFGSERINMIVLDVMLPQMDGFQVCEQIRLKNTEVPILFLTAKDSNQDKVTGLKLGGDDYMTKPFNLEEFILRVKILVKHSMRATKKGTKEINSFRFGSNEINFSTLEAKTKIGKMQLTQKESMLLKLLVDRRNEVVSREQILQTVWGYDVYPSTRTIDNFILSFRKYFERDPREPQYFHSIRGIGYKFVVQ